MALYVNHRGLKANLKWRGVWVGGSPQETHASLKLWGEGGSRAGLRVHNCYYLMITPARDPKQGYLVTHNIYIYIYIYINI